MKKKITLIVNHRKIGEYANLESFSIALDICLCGTTISKISSTDDTFYVETKSMEKN